MLSPDDIRLSERDPALAGLAAILDDEVMLTILRGVSRGREIRAVRANYIRYKPGTSCIAGYSVDTGHGEIPVYARTHGSDSRAKLAKAVHRPGAPGPLGFGVAAIRNRDLVIFEAPNDDELRALPRLVRAESGRLVGADISVGEHSLSNSAITTLRYKPERRFVARIDAADRAFVLKVYTEADYQAIRKGGKQFASQGVLVVAEPAGHRSRHHAILFDWIEGEGLLDLAHRDRAGGIAAAARMGQALRFIHQHQPSKAIPKCDPRCIGEWLKGEVMTIEELDSQAGCRAADLAGTIMDQLARVQWTKAGLHGDFSHDQALLIDDKVVVLDFDRAMRGHPLVDYGRFAASLEMETLNGRLDESRRDQLLDAMRGGYGGIEGNGEPVHAFTAAQMLLRAHEPFRLRWSDWGAHVYRALDRVEELSRSTCLAGR